MGIEELVHWSGVNLPVGLLSRLLLAAVLGGLIGLEREFSDKPAGLRTNLLICVGATLLTEISLDLAANYFVHEFVRADPARLAAQIVSGIGFLGAGTIIQSRGNVTGLTTAATMWVVAAIGIAVGTQAYLIAIGTALFVLLALIPMRYVEKKMIHQSSYWFQIQLKDRGNLLKKIEDVLDELGIRHIRKSLHREREMDQLTVKYDSNGPKQKFDELQEQIMDLDGVDGITINKF